MEIFYGAKLGMVTMVVEYKLCQVSPSDSKCRGFDIDIRGQLKFFSTCEINVVCYCYVGSVQIKIEI